MRDIARDPATILLNASHTSLQELTVTTSGDIQVVGRQYLPLFQVATRPKLLEQQNLRTMTLQAHSQFVTHPPTLRELGGAIEILGMVSASALEVLEVQFGSSFLAQLVDDIPEVLEKSSLRRFEQSIARFTAGRTAVSFLSSGGRKNRIDFWTPVLARAFPQLYKQGKLIEST